MKQLLITLVAIVAALPLSAQKGLRIDEVFKGNIVNEQALQESLVKGESLEPYKLKVLHTVKFTTSSTQRDRVEALFMEDMKGRLSDDDENLELEYRDGHLYYAIVQIADTRKGLHRYICYQSRSNTEEHTITLVYLEGKASLADLRKTFKKK